MQIRYNRYGEKPTLDVFKVSPSKFVLNVSGIERGGGLKQKDFAFLCRKRPVLDAARDDNEFARLDPFATFVSVFPIVHAKTAAHDQEHLVFSFMVMPGEWSLKFHQLDELPVQLAGDTRVPMVFDEREFFGEIDLLHC